MPSVDLLAVHDDKETADVIKLDRQDLDRYSKVGQQVKMSAVVADWEDWLFLTYQCRNVFLL